MVVVSIIFAFLLFSFLIFIHEFGHFIAAKLSGVQVNEFAIFMGPAILKKKIGETLYSLRCIPLGGYCAMEGEDEDTENPRSFQKAAWWKRLIILIAGSAMNLIAGFLLLLIFFSPSQTYVDPVISSAESYCTVVCEDGLQIGDRFVSIDGEAVYVAADVTMLFNLGDGSYDIVVERNGIEVLLDDYVMEAHLVKDPETGAEQYRYGFNFAKADMHFGKLLEQTWLNTVDTVRTVRLSLQMLVTGKANVSDMTGPVGIVSMMSATAQNSKDFGTALLNLTYFGGFIAINLAVMNMLPIPALDGGRVVGLLLTTIIEKITKKKLNPKYEGYIHGVFMVLLLVLMAVIMFKDVFTIIKG